MGSLPCKGLPRHFGGLSVFFGGEPLYDPGEVPPGFLGRGLPGQLGPPMLEVPQAPWCPRRMSPRSLSSIWTTWWRPPCLPGPPGGGPSGPPRSPNGGPPGPPGPPRGGISRSPLVTRDLKGPPKQSFIWQSGSTLDQSIVDMNWSVMQLLTATTGSYHCAIAATNAAKSWLCK